MQNRSLPTIALVLRVLLGAWFAYSGGDKLFVRGLSAFTQDVANYRLLTPPWDAMLAYMLPWLEVVAGLCLIIGRLTRGALLAVAGMTLAFAVGVGFAWSQGLNIACGCRDSESAMNYPLKFAEFFGYWLAVAFIWWQEGKEAVRVHAE
jgi:putative oxidoreductase